MKPIRFALLRFPLATWLIVYREGRPHEEWWQDIMGIRENFAPDGARYSMYVALRHYRMAEQ